MEIRPSSKEFLTPNFLFWWIAMSFFFFVQWRKERKDGNSCWALHIQEFGYREMLVFAMGLSRNISFCDKPGPWEGKSHQLSCKAGTLRGKNPRSRVRTLSGENPSLEYHGCRKESLCCSLRVGNSGSYVLVVGPAKKWPEVEVLCKAPISRVWKYYCDV